MPVRSPEEAHRAATPLELFFDLVFVVAVARAAVALHHAVAEGHAAEAALNYGLVFFAIWWAWMNFTWFASAYDTDDVPYRIVVFVQMAGALVMAAGVPDAFQGGWRTVVYGFVIMRAAMVFQWLRAAAHHDEGRKSALRYAIGVTVLQVCWVLLLRIPEWYLLPYFLFFAFLELLVPIWAAKAGGTSWHTGHIVERYGLFTIIVLGESVLAGSAAVDVAADSTRAFEELLPSIGGGLLLMFSMWWIYFGRGMENRLRSMRRAFLWGYGHYFVFGAGAAVGAGLAVWIDYETDHAEITGVEAAYAVAIPVAIYLMSIWVLHASRRNTLVEHVVLPMTAALVLATPYMSEPVLAAGLIVAACLAFKLFMYWRVRQQSQPAPTS